MKDKWIMTMTSIQRDENKNEERSELNSEIDYWTNEEGDRIISYMEPIEQEMGASRMEIRVHPEPSVSVCRTGMFQTQLCVQTGRRNFSQYQTPFGDIMVSVIARYIHNDLTEDGGKLAFRYRVDGNNGMLSDVEIILEIKKN